MSTHEMTDAAVAYAQARWAIIPLAGKVPAISKRRGGNGFFDATTDIDQVLAWWGDEGRRLNAGPFANIGARVPAGLVVIDIDPRHDGHLTLARWEATYGPIPETLMSWSGRGDGGRHYWFRHPGVPLTAEALSKTGVDLKTNNGYVVVPPSIHPDSGQPYRWEDETVSPAAMPLWLVDLLRPTPIVLKPSTGVRLSIAGDSIADWFTESTTWADVLQPFDWRATNHQGTSWLHPAATSSCSATVTHDCLFVYSPNTPFEVTEPGNQHGYTRFRAWAVLAHGGDLSAAARAAREMRTAGRVVVR